MNIQLDEREGITPGQVIRYCNGQDIRGGIEEAGLDQQAMRISLQEVER